MKDYNNLTEWIKHTNDYDQNDNNDYDKYYPHLKADKQIQQLAIKRCSVSSKLKLSS